MHPDVSNHRELTVAVDQPLRGYVGVEIEPGVGLPRRIPGPYAVPVRTHPRCFVAVAVNPPGVAFEPHAVEPPQRAVFLAR